MPQMDGYEPFGSSQRTRTAHIPCSFSLRNPTRQVVVALRASVTNHQDLIHHLWRIQSSSTAAHRPVHNPLTDCR